jgi:hypothetical protein
MTRKGCVYDSKGSRSEAYMTRNESDKRAKGKSEVYMTRKGRLN